MKIQNKIALFLSLMMVVMAVAFPAKAIDRDRVMTNAKSYALVPWHCKSENLTVSCDSDYETMYTVGDYQGVPYHWGGYLTLHTFLQQIDEGYGPGSYAGSDPVVSCATGVDCSGYVSSCWETSHHTTVSIPDIATKLTSSTSVKPGDAFDYPDYHVVLFAGWLTDGEPYYYESMYPNVHPNMTGGWDSLEGFSPYRFNQITDVTGYDLAGTMANPIDISLNKTAVPYYYDNSRDTSKSSSQVYDYYAANWTKNESGPEFFYRLVLDKPGQLTATIEDGSGVDIDVHLCRAMSELDCFMRNDITVTYQADCGTYYIITDTFVNANGPQAGPFTLHVYFTPNTQSTCGNVEPPYDFVGEPGDPCAYTGDPDLPLCNVNSGSDVCLVATLNQKTFSFCSMNCAKDSDCYDSFPSGCCVDTGDGLPKDFFCAPQSFCGSTNPDPDADLYTHPDTYVQNDTYTADLYTPKDTYISPKDTYSPVPDLYQPKEDTTSEGETVGPHKLDAVYPTPDGNTEGDGQIIEDTSTGNEEDSRASAGKDVSSKGQGSSCSTSFGPLASSYALMTLLLILSGLVLELKRKRFL